ANVGFGSVIRACQRAGFREFNDLRTGLAIDLLAPPARSSSSLHHKPDHTTPVANILEYVLSAAAEALRDSLTTIDADAFAAAVAHVAAAASVTIFGAGSVSGALAQLLQVRLLGAGIRAVAVSHSNDHIPTATLLTPGDVAVGISQSGDTASVVEALRASRDRGVVALAITGYPQSALARASTCALTCAVPAELAGEPAASRVSMVALFDALAIAVLLRRQHPPSTSSG
ncbi:MAG: MurR/RpiR family transcriptional regulator, partial [Chloroflexi bacterium]|nr:MurR/RpiR family transcriptional regulator [Chloroflexota bacterium]